MIGKVQGSSENRFKALQRPQIIPIFTIACPKIKCDGRIFVPTGSLELVFFKDGRELSIPSMDASHLFCMFQNVFFFTNQILKI